MLILGSLKEKSKNAFGDWYISKRGRWVKRSNNPNEVGAKELEAAKAKLTPAQLEEVG